MPAIFILCAGFAGYNKTLAVIMFTLTMGFLGAYFPGLKVNPLDLSPNYAGSLMALTNGNNILLHRCFSIVFALLKETKFSNQIKNDILIYESICMSTGIAGLSGVVVLPLVG